MTESYYQESIRVTSVSFLSKNLIVFKGIPLRSDAFHIAKGKYHVTVLHNPAQLPVPPNSGQVWQVRGLRRIKHLKIRDYLASEHEYRSPDSVKCVLPETEEQLVQFITREPDFKGIGAKKARDLWLLLGHRFDKILSKDTKKHRLLLSAILSSKSIDSLYNGYSKYRNLKYCNWMTSRGIPSKIQLRLLKYHNEKIIDAIENNPYLLIGFGMSFEKVDALSQGHFYIDKADLRRLNAALESAMKIEIDRGHTYSSPENLKANLFRIINDKQLVNRALKAANDSSLFVVNSKTGTFHPIAQYLMETVVSKRLIKLVKSPQDIDVKEKQIILDSISEIPHELTKMQRDAFYSAVNNMVCCITGGAGTGKTTLMRVIAKAFNQLGFEVNAVALSGRAATRLKESIGFQTKTIASLLRGKAITPFRRARQILIVDESSMIDLPTLYQLINHTHESVRYIFTGDPDQLPPIGYGKVLSDLVESRVIPNTRLDIVQRQDSASGIPEYSQQINKGTVPHALSQKCIHFHDVPIEQIETTCTNLYQLFPASSQIVCSTLAMGQNINKRIQAKLNPRGQAIEFVFDKERQLRGDLRKGDRILFTKNHYEKGVQNGSLGTICLVTQNSEELGLVRLDSGLDITLDQDLLNDIELGYCITLHKAQGSQFPRVIVAFNKGRIVDRAWLYTAITRAETEVHIVGSSLDFSEITKSTRQSDSRNSHLKELLRCALTNYPQGVKG